MMMQLQCEDFLTDWLANSKWWFCPSNQYDEYITEKYGRLLSIKHSEVGPYTPTTIASMVVVYDQIPRHVYRKEHAHHIIEFFLQKSLSLLSKNFDRLVADIENAQLLCFVLLPLRHSKRFTDVVRTIEVVWRRLDCCESSSEEVLIYKRFLKAAYDRMPDDQHIQRVQVFKNDNDPCADNISDFHDVLDPICFENVSHPYKGVLNCSGINTKSATVVSLSGGVDSMVCLDFAIQRYGSAGVRCVHINYANRPTANKEEEFVRYWCAHKGVPLHVRRITEINRPLCMKHDMRQCYEDYTKKARFMAYKQATDGFDNVVVLGHNKDDCFENIMTNIKSKSKYDCLVGMEQETVCKDYNIILLRPLLNVSKSDIIKYAQANNIPFLYDSTVEWSQRGKIRDKVVPALKEWCDDGFIDSAFHLSRLLREMHEMVASYMDAMEISKSVDNNRIVITVNIHGNNRLPSSFVFWNDLLVHVFGTVYHGVSQKSIKTLVERITNLKTKEDKLVAVLSNTKQLKIKRETNGLLITFYVTE